MTGAQSFRLAFIVESGTDVRLVEGLAARANLTVVARRVIGGREISQPTAVPAERVVGPSSFVWFAWFAFRWLLRHGGRYDVVLVQGYGLAALATNIAAALVRVPAIMLVCSPVEAYYACRRIVDGERSYRWIEALGIWVIARLNAAIARRYIVLSPYLATVVRSHGTRAVVDVIPVYGVDISVFRPDEETRFEVRRRLGLPTNASLIFFSSRIAPEKDPDTLLAAVNLLRAERRDVRVLHLSGGFRTFLERADRRSLRDAVVARDAVPPFTHLAEWYRAADVCVQASREEGLGFSPLEALACGVPVVAAAVGGLRDTIRDGDTGWTYPVGDVRALADALRSVLDHPLEAERRAARGRQLVCREYARDLVFDAFVELLTRGRSGVCHAEGAERAVAG